MTWSYPLIITAILKQFIFGLTPGVMHLNPNELNETGKCFIINDALLEADYVDAIVIVDSFKKALQKEFKILQTL